MKYNELVISPHKKPRRAGRGISAGRGKTAGRGTKGQGARAGSGARPGFEGGQIPLYMRLPKLKGFKSIKSKSQIVYTKDLTMIKNASVDASTLFEAGLISNPYDKTKLILKGELSAKKDVKLPAASKQAVSALEKAGGSFTKSDRLARKSQKESIKKS
jgi:large subunit ribosomal protein L15